MSFVLKSVNDQGGVGADVKELRVRRGLSIADASRQTKIIESTIRAWEEERWNEIDDPLYSERVFRSYVSFLGGAETYLLNKYRQQLAAYGLKTNPEEYLPRVRNVPRFDLAVGARVKTVAIFSLFVALLAGYVFFQVRAISIPPSLEVTSPQEGLRLAEPRLHVTGKTQPEATVVINDRNTIVQPDGSFSLELDVPRGTTLIVVSAKKRHGREAVVTRRVIYDRPMPSSARPMPSSARPMPNTEQPMPGTEKPTTSSTQP